MQARAGLSGHWAIVSLAFSLFLRSINTLSGLGIRNFSERHYEGLAFGA